MRFLSDLILSVYNIKRSKSSVSEEKIKGYFTSRRQAIGDGIALKFCPGAEIEEPEEF